MRRPILKPAQLIRENRTGASVAIIAAAIASATAAQTTVSGSPKAMAAAQPAFSPPSASAAANRADTDAAPPVQEAKPGSAAAAAPGVGAPDVAANPSGTQLQEIVVTAQKREQSINSVPITVTAVTGDALVARGITQCGRSEQGGPRLQLCSDHLRRARLCDPGGLGYTTPALAPHRPSRSISTRRRSPIPS